VTIVAVSKKHPVSAIREALAAGVTELGENYAQELVAKRAELRHCTDAHWHFIGRLQRNKAKFVAGQCALIHAVDNVELARELAKRRPDQTRVQPILLALSGEASKAGVHAQTALDTARELITVEGVRLDGLMTMPPPRRRSRGLAAGVRGPARLARAAPASARSPHCPRCRWA
jgi:pyridoxal phosphate enzyme (YggS family)